MTSGRAYGAALPDIWGSLIRNRKLIYQMARREVLGRYRGSLIGLAWSFFNPLLMLGVYTFFFSYVFKARWGTGTGDGHTSFAIMLFVGLIIHGLLAECITRAPTLINSNVSYVKKVVFPLEVLPWIALGSALFHAAISALVLLMLQLVINATIPWTAALFPLVLAPMLFMSIGIAWFLAATGVYIKDIAQATGMIVSVLMFVSPVFYPISTLPPAMQAAVQLNPLTLIIEESRKVLLLGQFPDWSALGLYSLVAIVVAWFGFWWFQKTRNGFADVL